MSYKLVTFGNFLGSESVKTSEEILVDILYHLNEVDTSKVISLLAQAGGRLHRALQTGGPEEADQELVAAYCPEPFRSAILEIKKQAQNTFLFTPLGFRLIYHLLIHRITNPSPIKTYPVHIGTRTFVRSNTLWVPIRSASKHIKDLSLFGIFSMGNQGDFI